MTRWHHPKELDDLNEVGGHCPRCGTEYRPGFTTDAALAMMAAESGTHFDPELFPRFERIVRGESATLFPDRESFAAP